VAVWRTHFYRRPAWTDIETDLRKGWYGGEHGRRRGDAKCKFSHVLLLSSSSVKTPAHAPRSDVPANPEGEIQSSTTSNRKRERDAGQGSSSVTRKGTTRLTRVPQVDIQLRTNRSRKMARLREFDYERVLDGALQLFWRSGYEATSLDGLLGEVGLSKSSFYGAFGSKHEMLLAALDRYIETVLAANIEDLRRGSARAAIVRSFEKIVGFQPSSKTCFLQLCAIELAGHDQLVRMRVRRGLELLEEAYREAIVRGQAAGEFVSSGDARALATFLMVNLYGLQVLGRANFGADARKKTLVIILNALS
jgi:TetR/AcrR family transcriptional repressor of nem operon